MTTRTRAAGSTRRKFVKSASVAAASGALALGFPVVLRGALSDRIYRVGLIGAGWYGPSDLWRLLQFCADP